MAQGIDALYQLCDPARPLKPRDPRYVPCDNVRGEGDLVGRIARAIRRSEDPLFVLFAGHRGGGKSTELLRLKDQLATPLAKADQFFVVYFEADEEDVDVNDIDFPDLLLAMIRHVAKALHERLGQELRPTRLVSFVDNCKHLLGSKVEFDGLTLDAKIAKITASIKSSPDARLKIREALEPQVSNLIQAANDLLTEAVTRLKGLGYYDLVLIVDNLDRITLRDIPGSAFNTHEQLFIHRGDQLAQLRCHPVYTLPISMIFSPTATALRNVFGKGADTLPMIRVTDRADKDYPAGMEAMRDIVHKSITMADVQQQEAFDAPETLDYLCRMSGGHTRNLLILLRSACDRLDALPLARSAVEEAVRGMCNDFERSLNKPEFFQVLQQIQQKHSLPGTEHDQLLLYNLSVLEYEDDTPCYSVNPAVRIMEKFKAAKKVAPRSPKSVS